MAFILIQFSSLTCLCTVKCQASVMVRKCFTETMAILIYYEMENSKARRQFQNNVQAVIDVIQ